MMAVLDLLQRGIEFPLQLLGDADAEDLADLVRGQPTQPNLAGAFEDAVDGEVALDNEIEAVLDLVDGVKGAGSSRSAPAWRTSVPAAASSSPGARGSPHR